MNLPPILDRPGGDAVHARAVSFFYRRHFWTPRVAALTSVDLSVPSGVVFGLIGANGAGKSTLLGMCAGVLPLAQGSIEVFGATAGSAPARARVSYLPEESERTSRLKVRELLELHGALYGLARDETSRRVPQLLDALGIEALEHRPLRALSKGQRRRAALARALLPGSALLLLDEPLNGVDPSWCARIRVLLREYVASGGTVVFTSHLFEDVEGMCDRLMVIDAGRVLAEGSVESVLARPDAWQIEVDRAGRALPAADEVRARLLLPEQAGIATRRPLRSLAELFTDPRRRP